MRRHPLLLAVLLLAAGAPALGAQSADSASAAAEIDAVYARFSDGYRQASAAAVAALYAEDAYYLQPNADIVRGRAAIQELFGRFLDPFRQRGSAGPAITFEIIDRRVGSEMAWDIGYYDIGGDGRDGKFVVLWRRDADGAWRIYTDAYSGLRP